MKYKIETLPTYRIAYLRQVGPYGPANIEVMEKLKNWASEENLLKDSILFAIPLDNPETTHTDHCRFDACIVLPENYPVNDYVLEGEIIGGKYIVFEVKHTADDISKAYFDIFQFLQTSGYKIENKPIMEKYIGDINSSPYCEICVPVEL